MKLKQGRVLPILMKGFAMKEILANENKSMKCKFNSIIFSKDIEKFYVEMQNSERNIYKNKKDFIKWLNFQQFIRDNYYFYRMTYLKELFRYSKTKGNQVIKYHLLELLDLQIVSPMTALMLFKEIERNSDLFSLSEIEKMNQLKFAFTPKQIKWLKKYLNKNNIEFKITEYAKHIIQLMQIGCELFIQHENARLTVEMLSNLTKEIVEIAKHSEITENEKQVIAESLLSAFTDICNQVTINSMQRTLRQLVVTNHKTELKNTQMTNGFIKLLFECDENVLENIADVIKNHHTDYLKLPPKEIILKFMDNQILKVRDEAIKEIQLNDKEIFKLIDC